MKRRIGLLAASAILATLGFFAPASPASAHTDVCAGTGTATLSAGLALPTNGPAVTANFTFGFLLGQCASGGGVTATGTVTGWCGSSSGGGTVNGHHAFGFTSTGTVLVLTGPGAFGVVSAVEDPQDAPSCGNKNAVNFLITGLASLV